MQEYRHVLVATDLSEGSLLVAQRAAHIAKTDGAKLTLLHIVEHFPVDRSNELIEPETRDPAAYSEARGKEALARLAERLEEKNPDQQVLLSSRTAKREIIRYADENGVDLMVIGSHGWSWIDDLLGSTADRILHRASCDVMVVRLKK